MTKSKLLFGILTSIITGVLIAGLVLAFNNPLGNPPTGTGAIIGVSSGAPASSLYINSSGNVGIGTASPGAKLHVVGYEALRLQGDVNNAPFMSFYNQTGSRIGYIQSTNNSDMIINQEQAQVLRFATTGTERMRIDNTGNVGIGTVSLDPNYKITTAGGGIKAVSSIANQPAGYFDNPSGYSLITGSGNVGIGTAGPTNKLQVNGDQIRFERQNTALDTLDFNIMSDTIPRIITNGHLGFIVGTGKSYRFDVGAGTEVMRITAAGNVGIGIADPGSYKLNVNGNVNATAYYGSGANLTGIAGGIPSSKIYDSGWFAVSANTSYTKTHNLGTTKLLILVYVSATSDGSGRTSIMDSGYFGPAGDHGGIFTYAISATNISLRTANSYLYLGYDASGGGASVISFPGYSRVVILALE